MLSSPLAEVSLFSCISAFTLSEVIHGVLLLEDIRSLWPLILGSRWATAEKFLCGKDTDLCKLCFQIYSHCLQKLHLQIDY
ncbi:hypothetical protein H5410_008071 [Solanum commersonii]|uniref:Uncharacterized protein n=1 Tax=Solanum commersonii TaxID=4109 RepID=A0A9J6ADW3_SOLCO|nr:hypothetical protein H5410_008071 [Solanum commersonii]